MDRINMARGRCAMNLCRSSCSVLAPRRMRYDVKAAGVYKPSGFVTLGPKEDYSMNFLILGEYGELSD